MRVLEKFERLEQAPFVAVSFKKGESGRAWSSAANQLETVGLPGGRMVVDIRRLRRIQTSGITEVYLGPNGDDNEDNKSISIDDLINRLQEYQKKMG